MSKASYKHKEYIVFIVRCTFSWQGRKSVYDMVVSCTTSPKQAIDIAHENHLWSKAPDFKAEIVKIHFC